MGNAPSRLFCFSPAAAGRGLRYVDMVNRTRVCVVGSYIDSVWYAGGAVGQTIRIGGEVFTIVGREIYTWNDTGYLQLAGHTGKTARLYYNDEGSVTHVYLPLGTAGEDDEVLVAQTDSAAETITVAGCTLPVLQAAWESLADYQLGEKVTLLLTDEGKVAAATSESAITRDMVGVLSTTGSSVTLVGSGLTLTADEVDAKETLRGRLVRVTALQEELRCYEYTAKAPGALRVTDKTLGDYPLAPGCQIYEEAASSFYQSYVTSLSGEVGVASTDLQKITYTGSVAANKVTAYRLNSAGQVDLVLLRDVTGNAYDYGKLRLYTGNQGIDLGTSGLWPSYHNAVTLQNGQTRGESVKYLSTQFTPVYDTYSGVALSGYNARYTTVASMVTLTKSGDMTQSDFFLYEEAWYAKVGSYELPVSEKVQVYLEPTEQWLSGEAGLKTALASGLTLRAHYDRSPTTGAQVRVITAEK